jgi:hypothetical protein
MNRISHDLRPLCLALFAAGILSACGGGGGGGDDGQAAAGGSQQSETGASPSPAPAPAPAPAPGPAPTPVAGPDPVPATASMLMSCPGGASVQCSGRTAIRTDNGVTLTSSGVQAYGKSTSDANPLANPTAAFGFASASGGLAEMRVTKDANSTVNSAALLLSNLGLSWDGKQERPPIVDTFSPTLGRTTLDASGAIVNGALPAETDLAFFDYGTKGVAGTQANYANNRYFPRTNPSRCPAPAPATGCPTTETTGVQVSAGDWRTGGGIPDIASAVRVHGDGDVHAGNGPNDASGQPTIIVGGTGPGVPFPGSKGYRGIDNWGLQYANLATWVTQDTVNIEEWAALGTEHNKNRRGIIAYGAVTDPATVPTSGSASYSGIAYGWYAPNGSDDPAPFRGTATLTVNFATRQVNLAVQNALSFDAAGAPVPVNFTTTAGMGANGTSVANYLNGKLTAGSLSGGLGGRYFGPVAAGGSGAGPLEMAGAFQMTNDTSHAIAVGGFVTRKQ